MFKTKWPERDLAYDHFYLLPLLNAVTSFGFIISLIGLFRLLHPLPGIANPLQGRGVDIMELYDDVSSAIKDIKAQGRILIKSLV